MGCIEARRRARALGVSLGVDGMKHVGAPLVRDPRRLARIDEAAGDGDELTGEEMQIGFPVGAIHRQGAVAPYAAARVNGQRLAKSLLDRKSTRLNSSHSQISYAVFCLKKKRERSRMPSTA